MKIGELISCAEEIQRPCLHLVEAGCGAAASALWGGKRSGLDHRFRHILSFDFDLFERIGLKVRQKFALVTFIDPDGIEGARAQPIQTGSMKDAGIVEAEPLVWREANSFPPLPALCLYGNERIDAWLKEMGLERWRYDAIPRDIEDQYNAVYQERTPLYSNPDVYAQIGGWHTIWPEDNFYLPREMTLLCWTLRDAEPWYEIFQTAPGNIVVKERIT